MRVLLVASNRMITPFPVYPIGIDCMATALRSRHEVRILDLACEGGRGRVVGSGNANMAAAMKRMYQRGQVGPLWDRLVPG